MHVDKEKLKVQIITQSYAIEGDIFVHVGSRLTDMLSAREAYSFLPVTDVVVRDMFSGKETLRQDFANVNRAQIVMIVPLPPGA